MLKGGLAGLEGVVGSCEGVASVTLNLNGLMSSESTGSGVPNLRPGLATTSSEVRMVILCVNVMY